MSDTTSTADGHPSGLAGRYARAVYELAREANAVDAVGRDLDRLLALVHGSPDLARVVKSPVFSREEQARALGAILERLGVHDLTRRFILLVAQKRRLFALERMVRAFRALTARARGEISAEAVSAVPLSADQQAGIQAAIKDVLKRDVRLDVKVDPALLGGLIVKVGSRMVDSSLATKLDRLKAAMATA